MSMVLYLDDTHQLLKYNNLLKYNYLFECKEYICTVG